MDNFEIRYQMKIKRENLSDEEVLSLSDKIFNNVLSLNLSKFNTMFIYKDFKNEVSTKQLITHFLNENKTVLYPVIKGDTMFAVKPTSNDYSLSKFGTSEPIEYEIFDDIDVCFLPLLACDLNKNRLGYGKGYYDKFLSTRNPLKIGLCYDFQIVEKINSMPWDIPLDYIVTEKRIIK